MILQKRVLHCNIKYSQVRKWNHARQQDGFPPGNIVIRCLLILWTGDYPAQSEVQKFIQGGNRPCMQEVQCSG